MPESATLFTDTERLDYIAGMLQRYDNAPAADFRAHLDELIIAARTAPIPEPVEWTDVEYEFPLDKEVVRVLASDGVEGNACFDSEALDWFVHHPGSVNQGKRWQEAHGRHSVIEKWRKL